MVTDLDMSSIGDGEDGLAKATSAFQAGWNAAAEKPDAPPQDWCMTLRACWSNGWRARHGCAAQKLSEWLAQEWAR